MNLKIIFIVILLSLAIVFITSTGPTFATVTASPTAAPAAAVPAPVPQAAKACGDKSKRYADCNNGTVTDTETGLIWLKDPNCLGMATWEDAKKAAANLKSGDCMLTDGSKAGDWRLPTDKEWEATMAKAKNMMCSYPTLTNDAGTGCVKEGPTSFKGLESDYYWSSVPGDNGNVFMGDLDHGNILHTDEKNPQRVWPVRK